VIDDEAQIRRFLDIGLRAEGYEVLLAANAADGLALAVTQSPDLVILDIGLPDREGHDVLAELRQWSQVPVLMLSVRDAESEKVRALDHGANDYVTKPFGIQELMARLRVLLRSRPGEPATRRATTTVIWSSIWRAAKCISTARCCRSLARNTPCSPCCCTTLAVSSPSNRCCAKSGVPLMCRTLITCASCSASCARSSATIPTPRWLKTEPGVGYRFLGAG
jgi:two-component system KDP operon response regulator KdpE